MAKLLNSYRLKPAGEKVEPAEVFEFARSVGADMIDLKFCDMLGTWQHCSHPVEALDEGIFSEGLGFDGSSIRGWQDISQSDMVAVCDPSTACIDPFFDETTVSLIADIVDPVTKEEYKRDPRHVAKMAEEFLRKSGVADTAYFGPEPEFFIFDEVRFQQTQNKGYYEIDSIEGAWNTSRFEEPNLGYKPSYKGGYFPVSPTDTYHNMRGEMVYEMMRVGITVEAHHHEVATGGQSEIDMKRAPLLQTADNMMWYKYITRNVAKRHGKTVTFMPKPIFEDNGSGMHTHFSLWKDGKPLFAGNKYAGLSDIAIWAAGGILKHAPAILAFTNPTVNSYRRLVPGFEAPVNLAMSARNRSASLRIPMYSENPKSKRLEFRCPDPTCNPYLAFSAILMAALDGINNKIDPGEPLDTNIYKLTEEELKEVPKTPQSLEVALQALDRDRAFLKEGGVFSDELIDAWISYKVENEIKELQQRPHPYEFFLYFDN
ncbi:MAG: type I glutamate--ammonia ligase [Candidatus Dadabacteria bacterium]|nr:MAG: type I glutamate--ammonia ligase [Candidatus Dadabacteria bacterium]